MLSSVQPAIAWCREKFDVEFSVSGMRDLLHSLDFVYKHTVLVPGNAAPQAQREFVEKITDLLAHKAPDLPAACLSADRAGRNVIRKGTKARRLKTVLVASRETFTCLPPACRQTGQAGTPVIYLDAVHPLSSRCFEVNFYNIKTVKALYQNKVSTT